MCVQCKRPLSLPDLIASNRNNPTKNTRKQQQKLGSTHLPRSVGTLHWPSVNGGDIVPGYKRMTKDMTRCHKGTKINVTKCSKLLGIIVKVCCTNDVTCRDSILTRLEMHGHPDLAVVSIQLRPDGDLQQLAEVTALEGILNGIAALANLQSLCLAVFERAKITQPKLLVPPRLSCTQCPEPARET